MPDMSCDNDAMSDMHIPSDGCVTGPRSQNGHCPAPRDRARRHQVAWQAATRRVCDVVVSVLLLMATLPTLLCIAS